LSYAQLQGGDLSNAQLQGGDLANANMQGTELTYAQLQGADLRKTQLQGAVLRERYLFMVDQGRLYVPVPGNVLPGVTTDLELADLRGADFTTQPKEDELTAALDAIPEAPQKRKAMERLDQLRQPNGPPVPVQFRGASDELAECRGGPFPLYGHRLPAPSGRLEA
jgi:hypothetical protein